MPLHTKLRDLAPVVVTKADGDLTCSASSNAWADVDTTGSAAARNLDVVIPNVSVGQRVSITPSIVIGATGAVNVFLDVFTVVAGSPVHQFGTTTSGIGTWYGGVSVEGRAQSTRSYVLAADDIENGSVRLRLRSKINHASITRAIAGSAGFQFVLEGRGPLG